MAFIENLEWKNHNAIRHYPITGDSSMSSTDGSVTIPDDFLIGMSFAMPSSLGTHDLSGFYVSKIGIYATGVTIVISYTGGTTSTEIASTTIPRSLHTEGTAYRLTGLGDYSALVGYVVVGTLDNILEEAAGSWSFDEEGARIEQDCFYFVPAYVSSIAVAYGGIRSEPISGDVVLYGESGVVLQRDDSLYTDASAIKISLLDTAGYSEFGGVPTSNADEAIRTINQVRPENSGNINLQGTDCVKIDSTTIPNTILIDDDCSEPCCGCNELQVITNALEDLSTRIAELEAFQNRIGNLTLQMQQTILGSKIGDVGCVEREAF